MSNGTTPRPANQNGPAGATAEGITDNPIALVAGGVAIGVLIGMLLPRAGRERELLEPAGRKLAERATSTVQAVKEAGKAEIDSLLPGRDEAKDRVSRLVGNLVDAAKGAAQKA